MDTTPIEKSLIRGKWDASIPQNSNNTIVDLAQSVVDGSFRDVLTSSLAREVFRPRSSDLNRPLEELFDFSTRNGGDEVEEELLRLILSIACLHAFVQANWTGPDLNVKPLEVLLFDNIDSSISITEESITGKAISELAYGGEPAYHLAQVPVFLRLSQLLLALPFKHLHSAAWWRLRTTTVHQQVLDEPVAPADDVFTSLDSLTSSFATEPDLAGRLYLEKGLLEHHLSQDKSAAENFVKAARITGLEYELTGALGKRTKFQEKELSQLVLLAESSLKDDADTEQTNVAVSADNNSSPNEGNRVNGSVIVPETLALNDDTLLEQTAFTSSHPAAPGSRLNHLDPSSQPPLHPLDQSILLSLCLNVRNTSPSHGLTMEQMSPYVSRVISHPRNWSIHTIALLLRSRLESSRTRTVERSTLQLQALIDQMPTSDSTLSERLLYFHSIPLPSKWEMEKELALRFMSLGVVKSALEIFERLEMWEEVVKCYGSLERPEKGIAIVHDLLEGRKAEAEAVVARGKDVSTKWKEIQDTAREAKLWCLLGDLEPAKAEECYKRAWEVSKETSGRAMRSLGGYYFARSQFQDAITCLTKAVKINPLLSRSWFILGCACMRVEDWEGGKNAFSRCVAIEEEDGESWNNLASMYLRMGSDKEKAVIADSDGDDAQNSEQQAGDVAIKYNEPDSKSIPFANKMLAFRALKQGLKFSYDNWRMWYNYMVVAMDVGELSECCRALSRVVEETASKMGAESVDEDVLERLVNAVTRAPANPEDAAAEAANAAGDTDAVHNPNEGHGLFRNVLSLFERTILPRVSSPRIFRSYARLLTWRSQWEDALKAYLDGYRCGVAGTMQKGETDVVKWREAVSEVEEIVDILRNFGPRVDGYKWRLQGRSLVRTFIGRTRDFEDEPEWERLMQLQEELRKEEE